MKEHGNNVVFPWLEDIPSKPDKKKRGKDMKPVITKEGKVIIKELDYW